MMLKRVFAPIVSVVCLAALSASCASVQFDPCSKEGIEHRVKDTLKDFAIANRGDLREVRNVAQYLDGETITGKMRIVFAIDAVKDLVQNFQDDVVPDVQAIARECNAPEDIKDLFIEFLEDEGVDGKVLVWVETLSVIFETDEIL